MILTLIGIAVGGALGFLQYRLFGCRSGACALMSSPVRAILYWGLIGGLAASGFRG